MDDAEVILAGLNLTFDLMKHLATLDTAVIAFIGVLISTGFKERYPEGMSKLVACLFFAFTSMFCSLIFLSSFSSGILYFRVEEWPGIILMTSYYISMGSFFFTLVFLIWFTFNNLNKKTI